MKTRHGFVSNSSSSSYICDICGHNESGWDLCISDTSMSECVNGHTFCNSHANMSKTPLETKKAYLIKGMAEDPDYFDYEMSVVSKIEQGDEETIEELYDEAMADMDSYATPEQECPICTFSRACSDEVYKYLIKKYGLTERQVLDEIKERFGSYSEFSKFIK